MSDYYNANRSYSIYDPKRKKFYKLSRSKIDSFLNCPRCFYINVRLGTSQPPGYPFTLNSAVDTLLKKEFDIHRAKGNPHPLMKEYKVKAVPFSHKDLDDWRNTRKGQQFLHKKTNFLITGAIDDIWINDKKELIIVDYKATSKRSEVNLDADWQIGYKRQMEIYQWLFRQKGFKVSNTGYFVYCNGNADKEAFDAKLEFDIKVIPYKGNDNWVEKEIIKAYECLQSDKLPKPGEECDYCSYRYAVMQKLKKY
ncbi:MAG: PD-(D/E)XK nuclease family protein [bacterium]